MGLSVPADGMNLVAPYGSLLLASFLSARPPEYAFSLQQNAEKVNERIRTKPVLFPY